MIQIPEEIKTLLKSDSTKKNFRVHFPNGEHEDLTNADIVEESVTLTESICSASQLKIGMCETPSIEFETIGVGYIRGAEIECSLEVESEKIDRIEHIPTPYISGNTTISGVTFECGEYGEDTLKISGTVESGITYTIANASRQFLNPNVPYHIKVTGMRPEFVVRIKCPTYNASTYKIYDITYDPASGSYQTVFECAYSYGGIIIEFIVPSTLIGATLNNEVHIEIKAISTSSSLGENLLHTPYTDGDIGETVVKGGWEYTVDENAIIFSKVSNRESTFTFHLQFNLADGFYYIDDGLNDHSQSSEDTSAYMSITDSRGNTYTSNIQKYVYLFGGSMTITHYFGRSYSMSSGILIPVLKKLTTVKYAQTYPSGTVYKSDIGKYVYPIPYGTYIVDSCKKQADMSHRQIIGYNKFAYRDWKFNTTTRNILTSGMYWYNQNLKVSLEGVLKLLFPDIDANYELATLPTPHTHNISSYIQRVLSEGYPYTEYMYVLEGLDYQYSDDMISHTYPSALENFKIEYDDEYVTVAKQIVDFIKEIGWDYDPVTPSSDTIPQKTVTNDLQYYHYSSGSMDYVLDMPSSLVGALVTIIGIEGLYESQTYTFADLNLTDPNTTNTTRWHNNGGFTSCLHIYGRLRLYRREWNGSGWGEVEELFDTGEHIPKLYVDTNLSNYNFFESPLGIYFPLTCKKKSVNMVKEVISSGATSTVKKTLYKYDFSSLLTLDLKSIVQSYLEIQGKFGLITRDGNINFVSVNEAFNSPDDTISKSDYYTLWYDDFPSKPYGRITASYKDSNGDDMFAYYDLVENFSDAEYKTYDISNNYFIKNYNYTEQQIQTILQTMGQNMTNISYMPMNLSMKGRPDLEAGDVVIVNSTEQEITGFIMQRTLTGIQGLVDDISSQDDTDQSLLASLGTVYDEETGTLSLYLSETRR